MWMRPPPASLEPPNRSHGCVHVQIGCIHSGGVGGRQLDGLELEKQTKHQNNARKDNAAATASVSRLHGDQ